MLKIDPKLSIIVPVYNCANHLPRCLKSILNQTFSDFEIILVNDGSTDESGKLCDQFTQTDPRIIAIHKENGGPGSARNAGLELAKGNYIGFVDSDDYIDNLMFETMINVAGKEQADIVQCGFENTSPEGVVVTTSKYSNQSITGSINNVRAFSLQRQINNFIHCKIFRKTIIDNIRFPNLYASEDAVFILQACSICEKLIILEEPFYKYVQHPESLTRSGINTKSFDTIRAGKIMFGLVHEKFPELSSYWALYIVLYCVKLFARSRSIPELKQQRVELINDFRQYYPLLKNSPALNQISRKSRVALGLFSLFPGVYALLYSASH
jgi:glycosyltransferase involved in cell wall biosynthesis